MRHCVYTYLNDCLKRRCRIFSMQEQIDGSYKRVLTIEVASGKLQQIKGKCNRVATAREKQAIDQWKREIKLY